MPPSLHSTRNSKDIYADVLDSLAISEANEADWRIACKNAIAQLLYCGHRLLSVKEPEQKCEMLSPLIKEVMMTRLELVKAIEVGIQDAQIGRAHV